MLSYKTNIGVSEISDSVEMDEVGNNRCNGCVPDHHNMIMISEGHFMYHGNMAEKYTTALDLLFFPQGEVAVGFIFLLLCHLPGGVSICTWMY